MQGSFVGSNATGVLDAKATIHTYDTEIVNPRHSELNEAFRFHQGLGDKGVLGIAIKNGRQALERGRDGIDEFGFVGIAALAFFDQQIGRFQPRLETNVSLTTKEGFVAVRFGNFHVLVDSVFAGNQRLSRSGSVAQTGTASDDGCSSSRTKRGMAAVGGHP